MSLQLIQSSSPQGQNNVLNQQQNNTQPNNNNQTPQNPPSWDGISDIGNEDWGIESLD